MLRSMTGFGTGRAAVGGEELTVELRSVNHKFCEVKVRSPRELSVLEPEVAKQVKARLARGTVDVSLRRVAASATGLVPQVDAALARAWRQALSEVAQATGVADEVSLRDLATLPNVVRLEEKTVDLEAAQKALAAALAEALDALASMREREGLAIGKDLSARVDLVETLVSEVRALVPEALIQHRDRVAERVTELAAGVAVDPQRLAQEIAFLAERTDVAEELTRLASHLAQFRALLASTEPTGRKMDFLVQEMHREVNTTGSKSQHAGISQRVLALKAELERIREQVQNVE